MADKTTIKLRQLLENIIRDEIDGIVEKLMGKFDKEIIALERDKEDPARPSLCRDEFELFLKEDIRENIKTKIVGNKVEIEIGVGNLDKLGFGEELDEDTTDCIRIIGTILQGIAGEYKARTEKEAGQPVGRFGGMIIIPAEAYDKQVKKRGWPPKEIWDFSNFEGVPDFFSDLDLREMMRKVVIRFGDALKK